MRLLFDTHAFIWALESSPRLSATAVAAIQDGENQKLISFATLWEITLKAALGKLTLFVPCEEILQNAERLVPGSVLACTTEHLNVLLRLPHHHRDPFDRMLVAQALSENLTLVSGDESLDAYSLQRLW